MTRRTLASCLATAAAGQGLTAAASRPNIVLLMADDLGYRDTELYESTEIPTPHIKSIGESGVLFKAGYVTAPVCSPSRAGLMTGRHQQRFGFEFNAGPLRRAVSSPEMGLPVSEVTLPELLKQAGYATGMVGKWHLGMHEKFHPVRRGFDEYFGFLFGANAYIDPKAPGVRSAGGEEGEPGPFGEYRKTSPILRNFTPVDEPGYLTDAFAREAAGYIERHKDRPFFLYTAFNAPHTPFQTTEKYYARFPKIKDERRRIYCSMVSALDDAVGVILAKLRETGLERNTLVVFLSDNGCATYTGACTNTPLRMGKLTHLEGGLRVPFALKFPGRIKAGMKLDAPVSSLDLLPTAAALAGASLPGGRSYDGVDLMPFLEGRRQGAPHEVLCWRNGPNSAIRMGKWKLFQAGEHPFLFDLSQDTSEQANLASRHPEVIRELKASYAEWEKQMKSPLWPPRTTPTKWKVDDVDVSVCI